MSEDWYRQQLLRERCLELNVGILQIENGQSRYPRFWKKLREYVDVVLSHEIPSRGKCWSWSTSHEIITACYDIISLLENPKEIGYFGEKIKLQDVFVNADGQTYLVNLNDALQNLDDDPHELRAYQSDLYMEGLLRAQWKAIHQYMFDPFDHLRGPYTRFWSAMRELMYVFPSDARGDEYKEGQFGREKRACEGIIALLLDPGKDENGNEIDLDELFRAYNEKKQITKIDWQKYLRNLEEVLEKVKTSKSFYIDTYTYRVVKGNPGLTAYDSTKAMKKKFEYELAVKQRMIAQCDTHIESLKKQAAAFNDQYQAEKLKYEACLMEIAKLKGDVVVDNEKPKADRWSMFSRNPKKPIMPPNQRMHMQELLADLNDMSVHNGVELKREDVFPT
jgi:hypothetical protein